MGSLTIFSKECAGKSGVPNDSLPAFYMSDFSVPGLLVGKFDMALQILQKNKFDVMENTNRLEIAITGADQVLKIVNLFRRQGIECEIADMVDQVYQG